MYKHRRWAAAGVMMCFIGKRFHSNLLLSLSVFYLSFVRKVQIAHTYTLDTLHTHTKHTFPVVTAGYCGFSFIPSFCINLYFFMCLQQEILQYKWANLNGCCLFDITHLESIQPCLFWYWTATFHNKIYSYWIYFNWNKCGFTQIETL